MILSFCFGSSIQALDKHEPIINLSIPFTVHNEVVDTFVFGKYSAEPLLVTATVEKKNFTRALKGEGDCELKDMMQVCGSKYLLKIFAVKINDQQASLKHM